MKEIQKFKISEINRALREVQKRLMENKITANEFNMGTTMREECKGGGKDRWCGTAGCIGGHVAKILDAKHVDDFVVSANPDEKMVRNYSKVVAERLEPLFFPKDNSLDWSAFTPAQGAVAIERYFNKAKDPWKGVAY